MTMTDPIADLLTRIRNCAKEGHETVLIPASRMKASIVRVLKEEGYIRNFRLMRDENEHPVLKVYLKYEAGVPIIRGLKRISTPGLRKYSGFKTVQKPLNGAGTAILSTSKGIMTHRQALAQKVGGEVLCEVW